MAAHLPQCASQPGAVMRGAGFCTINTMLMPCAAGRSREPVRALHRHQGAQPGRRAPAGAALAPSTPACPCKCMHALDMSAARAARHAVPAAAHRVRCAEARRAFARMRRACSARAPARRWRSR